jgi:Ser/Thr protein kinase RdoA (MazF antagonist)
MAPVVRIGDTVRRVTGPWTPTVHALLRHLESAGFDGAPRVLGIDERGREVLEYVEGAVEWPQPVVLLTDDGLARAATLLRRYHDAVADFVVPADAVWQFPDMADDVAAVPELAGEPAIVCHNDCAPWNLVIGPERWAFIDWDVAGPRPRLWDVAYAIRGMVLRDDWGDYRRRMQVFADAYGLDGADQERLPAVVVARIASSLDGMRRRAEAGVEPWARLWASGHRSAWEDTLELARRELL